MSKNIIEEKLDTLISLLQIGDKIIYGIRIGNLTFYINDNYKIHDIDEKQIYVLNSNEKIDIINKNNIKFDNSNNAVYLKQYLNL